MQPIDHTAILAGGKGLVPDYATQQLQRELARRQIEGLGLQNRAAEQQLAANERSINRDELFQSDLDQVLIDPSAERISALILRHPEKQKEIKAAWDLRDTATRQAELTEMGSIYSAAANERYDLAADVLRRRVQADREAGRVDPQDEAILAALESDDEVQRKAALGMIGVQLATLTGPDHFGATFGKIKESEAGFTLAPGSKRFDARGNVIAEAPFAPRTISVSPGETVIEVQPGGGDQASGGGAGGQLFERVLRAEGGTDAQGRFLISPAGAVGPAQVMPGTAPEAAALAGVPFDERRYRSDPEYNKLLGKAYLDEQLRRFGGDEALAAAAYNAGPGRVREALQKGGPAGWLRHVPPETQDYVAKVTGGASGGSRVIAQGAPKPGYQILSPAEVQSLGLNPGVRYQRSPEGAIAAISGQDTRTATGRPIPESTAKRVEGEVAIQQSLARAVSGFRDDFGGNPVTGNLENQLQAVFNTGTPGQRQWWADFRSTDNQIRNDLFGSALTATEKEAYEATTISPRMSSKTIRDNLAKRKNIIDAALERRRRFLLANKFNPEAVDALFAGDVLTQQQDNPPAPPALGAPPAGALRIIGIRPKGGQ